jgi:catechol 2,3-dioxygenase-like lactoylglutathione lyase family enzyme
MITTIGHAALRVKDLDRSLDFYCRQLGFRRAFDLDRPGEPSPWIVYLQIAPGSFLELFPDPAANQQPPAASAGYNHIALLVDDLEATLRELSARGLPIDGAPALGLDGNWQYWLTDPDGTRIELMQIMPGSPQAQADAETVHR